MKTKNPGKQRKMLYNAPLHKKRKWIASHLEENLLLKYDRRSIPVIEGDTVRIMRGSFRGHEDKVANVNVKKRYLEIEGITMAKADGNKIPKPIHPSNVMITKLNLTDRWRRSKLEKGLSEETKKEIEKEAEEQIKKEVEEEKVRKEQEELEKQEEEEKKEIEKPEESEVEKQKKTTHVKKKQEPQKEKTTKKASKPKKTKTSKKTTSKKTKTTKKTTKKKEAE